MVNLARFLHVDAEQALRQTSSKFRKRFHYVEARVQDAGGDWTAFTLADLDHFWEEAKEIIGK